MTLCKTVAASIIAIATPVAAAPADEASGRVLAPFAACRALADPAQRSLCYDRAYDGMRAGVANGDIVISDAIHRRATFGLPSVPPKRSGTARAASPVPIGLNEIDSAIVATKPYGIDMFAFQLADGGVWRMAEAGPDPQFAPGTKVHLKRVLLGGILLEPERGRPLKVMRIR